MSALEQLLAERYPSPEWATFFEVQNGTGWEHNRPGKQARRADALAFGIWPSRGYAVHGFEIKRSRSDWLREMRDPAKSESIAAFCDRWWLVLEERGLAHDSEVPDTWGILVPQKGKLAVARDAAKRVATPLTRPQLAAVLRQVGETTVPKAVLEQRVTEALEKERAHVERSRPWEERHMRQELEELKAEVAAFQEKSGLHIGRYSGGRELGESVARLRALSDVTGEERLAQAREHLQQLVGFCERDIAILAALRSVDKAPPEPREDPLPCAG